MLSVIIPTRNEARNIKACVDAVKWAQTGGIIEIIVIDNNSDDGTVHLAEEAGARVVTFGPERSAQRNRGGLVEAGGDYLFFVDADMRVKRETLQEILDFISRESPPEAMYVREEIAGAGYWNRVRNFERSFYDGTCIDGLRVFRKSLFVKTGGFDEALCGPEDWDIDRRVLALTAKIEITGGSLIHDEGTFSLAVSLKKKGYYSRTIQSYVSKWGNDHIVRKQLGIWYRFFGVFFENGKWKRAVSRPDYLFCIWAYRLLIGAAYLINRKG